MCSHTTHDKLTPELNCLLTLSLTPEDHFWQVIRGSVVKMLYLWSEGQQFNSHDQQTDFTVGSLSKAIVWSDRATESHSFVDLLPAGWAVGACRIKGIKWQSKAGALVDQWSATKTDFRNMECNLSDEKGDWAGVGDREILSIYSQVLEPAIEGTVRLKKDKNEKVASHWLQVGGWALSTGGRASASGASHVSASLGRFIPGYWLKPGCRRNNVDAILVMEQWSSSSPSRLY